MNRAGDSGMQCPACRTVNPRGARFCNQCGISLVQFGSTEFHHRFFDEQLAKLQRYLPQGLMQKVLNQRAMIEGERRQVTVMFCDMEGFTPLVERLGAEAAYTVMGQIYEILIREVHACGGTINEMTGDGIMALFGAPIALEEDSQWALWAARAVHKKIALFNKQNDELRPIRMRIGIHAGPVVVGSLGSDLRVEFKAVGDTVNLAARLESMAGPGFTYVSQAVYQKTKNMFAFERLGKKRIKGLTESLPVYKLLPEDKDIHRPRLGSERMLFSAMIGRNLELDRLELQVVKLVKGAGSIVNIIGEAGIGKSRLLAEMKKREVMQQVVLLEGRAISMGRNMSFHPIIDLLKQWAGIGVDDSGTTAFLKLEKVIRSVCGESAGNILPFVGTLMGMHLPTPHYDRVQGIEGEALEKLIRKSMRELLVTLSHVNPLMIVTDDLHWCDNSSMELLAYLFRLAKHERILFVNLFRPDAMEADQWMLDTLREQASVHTLDLSLKPLDEGNSEALIANMLNLTGLHSPVVEQIIQRAGGNPYFIEEVVRSFIDEGAVVVRAGKFEITSKFSEVTVPGTISGVLMARIDRLEEETRDLVKVAAVIGRSFFYRVLSEVAVTIPKIDERLSYLKEIQLIHERRRLEEVEYLFNHALAQEVAYASILPERRKQLHLKVAETIENVFAEKLQIFYGMLAYHYSRADNLEKTEESLIMAGEAALKTSASSEALHYYQEALNLYRRKSLHIKNFETVALLEKNIAIALYNRGQYEEAIEYFDKASKLYGGQRPQNPFALTWGLCSAFMHFLTALYVPCLKFKKEVKSEVADYFEFYYKKSKALSIIDPKRFFIDSILTCKEIVRYDLSGFNLGLIIFVGSSSLFSFTGLSFRLSSRILLSARKSLQKDQPKAYIIYDFMETIHNYLKGHWADISPIDLDLVKENLEDGEVYAASQHLYWHGCPSLYRGDFALAETIQAELSKIAEIYENDFSILLHYMFQNKLLLEKRHLTDALETSDQAITFAKKRGFIITLLDFYSSQARIFTLKNNWPAAHKNLKIAEEIAASTRATPIQTSIFLRSQAEFWLSQMRQACIRGGDGGLPEPCAKALKACEKLVKTTKNAAQHRTEAYRLKGVYYALRRRPRRALGWLRKSIREGERLGAQLELARTYFVTGKFLVQLKGKVSTEQEMPGSEYLNKAEDLFAAMGLRWDLAHLRRFRDNVASLDVSGSP